MRNLIALAIILAIPISVSAQKVMIPSQSSNPNLIITPTNQNSAQQASIDKAKRIERDEAIKLVKAKKAVFVDVRSKDSYDAGHIKGAISIPESELISHLSQIPPKMMIITYCA